MDLKTRTVDIRYSVANEGEMFDIMNILDGFLTVNFVEWQPLLRIKVLKVFRNACVFFKNDFLNYRYSWGHLEQFVKAIAWKIEKTACNFEQGSWWIQWCVLLFCSKKLFLGKSRIEDSRLLWRLRPCCFTHFLAVQGCELELEKDCENRWFFILWWQIVEVYGLLL